MVRRLCCVLPLALLLTAFDERSEFATVETTADAVLHKGRLDGTAETLTALSPDDAILLRFRSALIERWAIQKAVVACHLPVGSSAPAELNVAVTRGAWSEKSEASPQLTGGTLVSARVLNDGWFTFELPQSVSTELAFGRDRSLALTVPEGGRLAIHSRRTGQFMPYLLVRGHGPLIRNAQ